MPWIRRLGWGSAPRAEGSSKIFDFWIRLLEYFFLNTFYYMKHFVFSSVYRVRHLVALGHYFFRDLITYSICITTIKWTGMRLYFVRGYVDITTKRYDVNFYMTIDERFFYQSFSECFAYVLLFVFVLVCGSKGAPQSTGRTAPTWPTTVHTSCQLAKGDDRSSNKLEYASAMRGGGLPGHANAAPDLDEKV